MITAVSPDDEGKSYTEPMLDMWTFRTKTPAVRRNPPAEGTCPVHVASYDQMTTQG